MNPARANWISDTKKNRVNEANEAAQVLSEYPEFTLVSHRLCDRKIYRDAWGEAITVHEANNEKAQAEIECLVKEVIL